jgi:hypothetical protein
MKGKGIAAGKSAPQANAWAYRKRDFAGTSPSRHAIERLDAFAMAAEKGMDIIRYTPLAGK